MLITFASKVAESRDNKIVMLLRIVRYFLYNYTFFSTLKVLGIEL